MLYITIANIGIPSRPIKPPDTKPQTYGVIAMYLFKLLGVFSNDYWNGFADGVSIVAAIRIVFAFYAWNRKCAKFRGWFIRSVHQFSDNNAKPGDVDAFSEAISACWCLDETTKRYIIGLLFPIRAYTEQAFQSRFDAWNEAVGKLGTMASSGSLSASALFWKAPVRSACSALIHAGWFGCD